MSWLSCWELREQGKHEEQRRETNLLKDKRCYRVSDFALVEQLRVPDALERQAQFPSSIRVDSTLVSETLKNNIGSKLLRLKLLLVEEGVANRGELAELAEERLALWGRGMNESLRFNGASAVIRVDTVVQHRIKVVILS